MWNWLHANRSQSKQKTPARWLAPSDNPWGLVVLDCTQFACTMISFTANSEIAEKYDHLRSSTGEEFRNQVFNPTLSIPCNLAYKVTKRAPDGPIFKSQVMEVKWDIYLYDDKLYFCRSWGGELFYRATLECEPPMLRVFLVETNQKSDERSTIRNVDFLIKSHALQAKALHPLPENIGRDTEQLAVHSFSVYGSRGLYGTFEETIGTPYFYNQSVSSHQEPHIA
jgi:hypothetical protein